MSSISLNLEEYLQTNCHKDTLYANFIENRAILATGQFGSREHYSMSMALTKLVEKITHEMDKQFYSAGIFLDPSSLH